MKLTLDQAAAVIAAFGPCTVMYECNSPADIAAVDFDASVRLSVESIHAERSDDTGDCYREWKAARPGVLARLAALDFLKTHDSLPGALVLFGRASFASELDGTPDNVPFCGEDGGTATTSVPDESQALSAPLLDGTIETKPYAGGLGRCRCRAPKTHADCACCGSGVSGQICGVCREAGIDGPAIRGTCRTTCTKHKCKNAAEKAVRA